MNYEQAIRNEIEQWPGVRVEFGKRSKHAQAIFHYRGASRFVVYPDSPGDVMRGAKNCIVNVRQELRNLGANRIETKPRTRRHKVSNRPDRGMLANVPLAPVKADPFAVLRTIEFAPPPPKSRWKRMVGPLRTCIQAVLARITKRAE